MSEPENKVEKLKYRSKAYEKSHHHNLFLSANLKNQKGESGTIRTTAAPLKATCPGQAEISHKLTDTCGSRWLSTIMLSEDVMGKEESERGRMVYVLWREAARKSQEQ